MKERVALVMVVGAVLAAGGFAQEGRAVRTISVSGTAATRTAPDRIVWGIRLSDTNKVLLRAKEQSDAKLTRVLALREKLGIKPEDLETGRVSINREYERDEHGRQGAFKHFIMRRSVSIRQHDLTRFDEFLDRLASSAEMEVGFNSDSSRRHEVLAQTRLKALAIAKEKAEAMAAVVGAQAGEALSIDEYRPSVSGGYSMANTQRVPLFDAGSRPVVDLAAGTFAPGAIEVKVTVYATFALK